MLSAQKKFKTQYPETFGESVLVEYIWIGAKGDIRSKTKVLNYVPQSVNDLESWVVDGEVVDLKKGPMVIKPCSMFKDPLRMGNHKLVLCDAWELDDTPLPGNTRHYCKRVLEKCADLEPIFGIEQEYTLLNAKTFRPLGWPKEYGFPAQQGPYYCGNGADKAFGRDYVEAHFKCCLHAGVAVIGLNAEVMPGQWEYQLAPLPGVEQADHLWIARYLQHRVGEIFNVVVTFDPKPVPGDWNGAGGHCNFSTKPMREEGGMQHMLDAIKKLEAKHEEHIACYGRGNNRRLTGKNETADLHSFSYGVEDRKASIRIPYQTDKDQKGYLEDRRPAANLDPYLVIGKIAETCWVRDTV